MEQVYKDFSFILGFMVLALLVLLAFGEKAERGFLLMVLFSMVILRADKVADFMDNNFKIKDESEKEGAKNG